MARAAFSMALESPHIIADVIEVQEFPQLAQKYGVRGVPKTVINDSSEIVGMVPEETFLQHVLKEGGIEYTDDAPAPDDTSQISPVG